MRKNDMKLCFTSKKGKKRHSIFFQQVSRIGKRSGVLFLILVFAVIAGFTSYVIADNKLKNQMISDSNKVNLVDIEENEQRQVEPIIGPYGIGGSITKDEYPNEEVETTDAWMNGHNDTRIPTKVKGIYVTATKANNSIDDLIRLVEDTELNAMVIDIKDDEGRITYPMEYPDAIKINATKAYISDMSALVKKLKSKNIYLIARVVAFKDPLLAKERPELALRNYDGTVFKDKDGLSWVNPYKKEVWDYLIEIAIQCGKIGFDEVNFDYIRFSTDKGMKQVDFGEEAKNKTKIETITEFIKYAYSKLRTKNIFISADVYGAIINSSVDAKIVGQSYLEMSKHLDFICPMIYPSHYGDGYYGIKYPDTQPYELIIGALKSSNGVLSEIPENEHKAIVRPWLQDFTASWLKHYIKYGKNEVRDQINAVYDSGYEEWLLWNGAMNYTKEALMTEDEAKEAMSMRSVPSWVTDDTEGKETHTTKDIYKHINTPWKAQE